MITRCFDAVVFDLDGTLVDTAPDILAHMNDMLAELGRPGLDLADIRSMIGDGVRQLLLRGLEASGGVPGDIDIDALFLRFLDLYTKQPMRHGRAFDGVFSLLTTLKDRGVKLGVCTNKPQRPTDRILAALGLGGFFDAVIGGDTLAVRKPDPAHLITVLQHLHTPPVATPVDPARAMLIGDSATDLKTARAAGVPCVLVSFGYTETPAADLGADRVIDHFAELIPVLETFGDASA